MKQKLDFYCILLCFTVPDKNYLIRALCNHQRCCRNLLIPYWSVYQIISLFIGGSPVMAEVWKWCLIGLAAYAVRFLLYGISTSLSHFSAYTILENIRLSLAKRLMKAPLGTVLGNPLES